MRLVLIVGKITTNKNNTDWIAALVHKKVLKLGVIASKAKTNRYGRLLSRWLINCFKGSLLS